MEVFVILISIFLVLSIWRKLHQRNAQLVFKYRLYVLRDELRRLAYNNKIDKEDWVFDYFDNTLSKAISESYFITFTRLVLLALKHNDDRKLKEFKQKLDSAVEASPDLKVVKIKFEDAIREYVVDQHYVSANFIVIPLIKVANGTTWAAKKLNQWIRGSFVYPETSDYDHYAIS